MSLDSWKPFIDANGLVSPDGKISHNGLMFSSYYLMWLKERRDIDPESDAEIARVLAVYESCMVINGGFNRAPAGWTKGHLNQNDDYFAIGWVSAEFDCVFASFALLTARMNHGCLNNVAPGKFAWKAWLFRMPWLKTHLQFAAGEKPDAFGIAAWCLWMLLGSFKKRDSRVKRFMAWKVASKGLKSPVVKAVCDIWIARFKSHYSGIGHAEYFKQNHPVRKLMWSWL